MVSFQSAVASDVGELRYIGRQVVPTGTQSFGATVVSMVRVAVFDIAIGQGGRLG